MNETKTPLTNDFLQSLSDIMRAKGITKSALARSLGLRRQHVQTWLQTHGRHSPSCENLLMIQKWLKSLE